MVFTKNAKGFTLVELMIVISIIGVLAVTLMPVLTGAQARSRDAGRLASLNNISAALSTYNSDNGKYPEATTTLGDDDTGVANCISNAAGTTANALAPLVKGGKMPVDPQTQNLSGNCATKGVYGYGPLTKDGITAGGYYLVSNMETYQKANMNWDDAKSDTSTNVMGPRTKVLTAEPTTGAKDSVYVIVN